MDPIQFPEDFAALSLEQLTELRASAFAGVTELTAVAAPTPAQATEAERLVAGIASIDGEITARNEAASRLAAVRQFADANAEPPAQADPAENNDPNTGDGGTEGDEGQGAVEQPAGDGVQPGEPAEPAPVETVNVNVGGAGGGGGGGNGATTSAGLVKPPVLDSAAVAGVRPSSAAAQVDRFHAAADVPGLGTGQPITFDQLAASMAERFERFPRPAGDAEVFGSDPAQLNTFSHASISKGIPQDLMVDPRSMSAEQIEAVLNRAVDQSRLPHGSLVAAGGWCAPSETAYTFFDDGATAEGILSLPEVGAPRGGIRHTPGPDWADIYGLTNFFKNTEAQVIAGTASKPCFTVACPSFTDYRLDAYGYCFQIPFLTEAAYPELIKRYLQGSMLAYQHKMNADKIARLVALLGAAEDLSTTGAIGSLATTLMGRISLILDRERTKRRWGMNTAVEVVLAMWVKNAIKTDISLRTGTPFASVTDQQINAMFAAINCRVNWVYDWSGQDLGGTAVEYPATFELLAYKAGTFVGLTLPVVNLSSVYDAASLAINQYTGAFFEEGYTMVRMGFGGVRLKLPTCVAGLTGEASVTCIPAA